MPADFVHLHVHTQYSFLTSSVRLDDLAARTVELGMRAVAITDQGNMFGAVKHWLGCRKAGLAPLLGCEVTLARREGGAGHLVLLAATNEGYSNLVRLVSQGHLASAREGTAAVTVEALAQASKGLVALTGCLGGWVPQRILERGPPEAVPALGELAEIFERGALYVEIQDHGFAEQHVLNGILSDAAARLDLPLVATNDVHFVGREDAEAQVYLECMQKNRLHSDVSADHHGSSEMYLKSAEEMAATFAAVPDALTCTLRVAEQCSGLDLTLDRPMLPPFAVPEGYDTDGYLRHVSLEGLERRFAEARAAGRSLDEAQYLARLRSELDVITGMAYAGYFLIVWDFIREAKARGIPVGPGRGSGAGSLVAYALDITTLDPIPYGLLFERFLNPERVSMPDFDIDFCMVRRDEILEYVAQKYGKRSVGQIATFQNLKARSVIKDVARAMGMAANEAQRIASLIPALGQGKMATIEKALSIEPKLADLARREPRVDELLRQAKKLEGLTRHAGMHAAGVVISEGPLDDHVPCFANEGAIVTQYDKDDVERVGLVKFDFLGLRTLTVIDVAQRLVNARPDRRDRPLDMSKLPLDDAATYALVSSGDTTGVFQLESSGMQQLLRGLRPDCFEDIVAAVALYRPGPLGTGMIDDFVGGKHGRKPSRKLHPLVDDVLAGTYGVPVYQEQVMQIAQKLSGYTLGGADLLRRAMGKKKPEEMAKQKAAFVEGARRNGVSEAQADAIFQEIESFALYGFNKSHSAAYAVVTYQTAYLKAHYPVEFFCALMTSDRDKIEKVVRTISEARAWGVSVLPPDINASDTDFTVVYAHPDGGAPRSGRLRDRLGPQVRFGLGAVRGVGAAALESIFEARAEGGPFRDLFDFASRVDARKINKGVLEALVQCGAFDSAGADLGMPRSRVFAAVDRALERSRSSSRDREAGQTTLFGLFAAAAPAAVEVDAEYPDVPPWDAREQLVREKQSLGCYVTGHPLLRYGSKVDRLGAVPTHRVAGQQQWSTVTVAGIVENYEERIFRSGSGRAAFLEVEDRHGRVKAKLRGERIDTYAHLLASGEPVLVTGKVSYPTSDDQVDDPEPTLLIDEVQPLADRIRAMTKSVTLRLSSHRVDPRQLTGLRDALREHPGPCPIDLQLALPDGATALFALDEVRVEPGDAMLAALERVFGEPVAELV